MTSIDFNTPDLDDRLHLVDFNKTSAAVLQAHIDKALANSNAFLDTIQTQL